MNFRQLRTSLSNLVVLLGLASAVAMNAEDVYVPEELENWVDWVLHDQPHFECPYDAQGVSSIGCIWVREVEVKVRRNSPTGATFRIDAYAFAESNLDLPNSNTHKPHDVLLNGEPATLGGGNRTPRVTLTVGRHVVSGELTWDPANEPEFLHIPRAALVRLTLDTEGEVRPFLDNNHLRLWLARTLEQSAQEEEPIADTLSVRVFRHLVDGLPQYLTTYIELAAGGRPRVVEIGRVLDDEFSLVSVKSTVPTNVSEEGFLSVLVSRGENTVIIASRANSLIDTFSYEKISEKWPNEEIWGFQPNRNLRVVSVDGPSRVNLSQVQAPRALTELGSDIYGFVLSADKNMHLVEEQRGNVNPNPARFSIRRNLWLNFRGGSLVAVDDVRAQTDSELRIASSYVPGKVQLDGSLRLITFEDPENKDKPGINVDKRNALIQSVGVVEGDRNLLANGWEVNADSLHATLHLPPGWRLLWTEGVDHVDHSWLSQWSIWDVFICLLLVAVVFRIAGVWWAGVIALAALLTYQESSLPTIGWLILAGLIYLTNLIDAKWFRSASSVVYWALAVGVATVTIYHAAFSAREAIFPQLDTPAAQQSELAQGAGWSRGLRMVPDLSVVDEQIVDNQLSKQYSAVRGAEESTRDEASSTTQRSSFTAPSGDTLGTRYDIVTHGVTIQTGPGTPSWKWHSAQLNWSGPVSEDHTISLVLMPPWATRTVAAVSSLLLLVAIGLFVALRSTSVAANLPALVRGLLPVLAIIVLIPTEVYGDTPDARILKELQTRLIAPPECLPDCAYVEDVSIRVADESLEISLLIHAEETIAVALPTGKNSWNPSSISANGEETPLQRDASDAMHVLLERGKHTIEMSADVGFLNRFDIDFPMKPSLIAIDASGWLVEGLVEGRLKASQVSLVRQTPEESEEEQRPDPVLLSASQPIEPYVSVQRRLSLAYEPTVVTTVRRIAPEFEAFTVRVPLLPNETVLQSAGTVQDDVITLSFRDGQTSQSWSSQFHVSEAIQLTAPDLKVRHEEWSIRGSDFWAFEHEGITPIKSAFNETVFFPRTNETLTLNLTRPEPVPGNTYTIEKVNLHYDVGNRSHRTRLNMMIYASQSADFEVNLPDDAVVQEINVGSDRQPIPATSKIVLPIRTGSHFYTVDWLVDRGAGVMFNTPEIEVQQAARNINLSMAYPTNRWTLYIGGPTIGAAVMFWAVVVVVLLIAIVISRLPNIPVTTTDAILLSLGATLTNLWALLFGGVWILAIWVRSRKKEIDRIKFFYYLKQVAYIVLSITGFVMLVSAVPTALLGQPDMHIAGYNSDSLLFNWFADESSTTLPTAWVFSVPGWVFFAAMLVWSLWLAFALLRWSKAAWDAATHPEFWPAFRFWQEKREKLRERRAQRKKEQSDREAT